MTYDELKHSGFIISMHYSNRELAILGQIRDGLGGDEPIVLVSKVNPYDYHPVDFRDTTFELEDWQEAVKLAHELAMTPLDQRGEKMEPDWIKHAKWWFHSVLGRA